MRVSQKLQSVETKAEAVAPVVQQSASRSQQPIHAETSVGVLGTAPTSTKKNAHVLATATPKSRTSSSTRAGERVPRQRYVQACTHTPEEETHTKSLKTMKTCSSAHRALLPGKFSERKKGGGGGGGEQGDWRQLSRTQFAAKPHTALAAHVCLEGEKNKRAPQGGVQQSAAHAHTKLSPPAVPEQALLGAQAVASVAARRRRPWPPFIVPECVTGCWRTRTLCWKASPACSRCCCPAAPAGCTG